MPASCSLGLSSIFGVGGRFFGTPLNSKAFNSFSQPYTQTWKHYLPFCTSTALLQLRPTFDTCKFVERLEKEGLNRQQSEGIMNAIADVLSESMALVKKDMVTRADHEKNVHMYKVDFTSLRSEFKMQERNEFNSLKSETERLAADLERAKQRMREEITKLQASVRLDLSLEKGRMRDDSNIQEAKIREADSRVETEVSAIRTQLEANKYEIVRTIIGLIMAAGGLVLAYLRFVH